MLNLKTPIGFDVAVPETQDEDQIPKFNLNLENEDALNYYYENGFVIFSKCISEQACEQIRHSWDNEIKPYKGKIYRQTIGVPQKNIFNKKNWVMNPIIGLQSLNPYLFNEFRNLIEIEIFSNENFCKAFKSILREKPRIIQSMYFEGNSATREHQDEYYLGSEKSGHMTAGWLALEEIKPDAGRFFILPKSHKLMNIKGNRDYITKNYENFVADLTSLISSKNIEFRAPYLSTGDFLLWNSLTVHGSIDSQNENFSRSSITAHAIPESHKALYINSDKLKLQSDNLGHCFIFRDKCQSKFKNRLKFKLHSQFPNFFSFLRDIKKLFKQP